MAYEKPLTKWIGALSLLAGAVVIVGCGSDRGNSPTAPSSAVTAVPAVNASATAPLAGAVVLAAHAPDAAGPTTPTTHEETHGDSVEGEAVVTSLVAGTACPTLGFLIGPYTIKVTAATTFSGGTCGDIKVGTKVHVAGTRQGDGSLVASRISIQTHELSPEPVEGEGIVTSVRTGTACPTLEFAIDRYTITLTAATTFAGGTCTDIKVGTKVHVAGTRQGDGSLVASRISIQTHELSPEPVEGEGIVTSVRSGTTCPTLEFSIERYTIKLDASTTFDRGACADIKAGVRVHVKGSVNADGSVTASRVTVQGAETHREEPVEGDGGVTNLVAGTACPALQFRIREYTISVDASTTYVGGTCSDIKVGAKVGVKGRVTADKTVTATRITFRD